MKIYKFSSTFCSPCKLYKPVFEQVTSEHKKIYPNMIIKEVDIDDEEELANKFSITGIPTTIIADDNDAILYKETGVLSEDKLKNLIICAND